LLCSNTKWRAEAKAIVDRQESATTAYLNALVLDLSDLTTFVSTRTAAITSTMKSHGSALSSFAAAEAAATKA
jgi:hypothetical protein